MSPVSCAGFSAMRNVAPGVCRPFDRRRDGLVLGEGGAVLIVEAGDFAAGRGAPVLATMRGHGIVSDARSLTAPDPTASGPAACMRQAVAMAGLTPAAVDLTPDSRNRHGAQRPGRGRALGKVFGHRVDDIPCASIKSMLGHTLGAAGAMNAAAAIAARRGGYIPPTIHFEEPDPRAPVACSAAVRPGAPRHVLSNTLGFGGASCSIVMELAGDPGCGQGRIPRSSRAATNPSPETRHDRIGAGTVRHRGHQAAPAASPPVPDGGPNRGERSRPCDRDQERDGRRALAPGSFPGPRGDARHADRRSADADVGIRRSSRAAARGYRRHAEHRREPAGSTASLRRHEHEALQARGAGRPAANGRSPGAEDRTHGAHRGDGAHRGGGRGPRGAGARPGEGGRE